MTTQDDFQPDVNLPPTEPTPPGEPPASGFRLFELLLDPRGLQTLMLAGGGLLALGLVLWLAVIGVFDQPINAAVGLGLANLSLLGTGVWLAAKTRYRLAGRATAMLACLLMPLNLWFYDAQGLVTLADGGHLWLAALLCCVLYAAVARLLRDSLFVYAFAAGISMTGMLFLADGDVGRFWEVLAPSTLLVSLGVACIHAERLFPVTVAKEKDRPFTRDDFGLAFFRAGHTLLASGLVVLLAGRLTGRFYDTILNVYGFVERPDVATLMHVKLAALGLTLAGAYAYGYSRLTEQRAHRYSLLAVLSLAWSAVIGIDLLGIEFTEVLVVGLLGVFAIVSRLAATLVPAKEVPGAEDAPAATLDHWLGFVSRTASVTGVVLVTTQLVRGVWMASTAFNPLDFEFSWNYVFAAALVLVAEVLATRFKAGEAANPTALVGPTLVALAVVGGVGGLMGSSFLGPLYAMTALLVGGCVAAYAPQLAAWRPAFVRGAEAGAWLVAMLGTPLALFDPTLGTLLVTLGLVGVFAAVAHQGRRHAGVVALLLVLGFGCQATVVYQLGVHLPLILLTVASVATLVVDRWTERAGLAVAGRVGLLLAATAGALLAGNRVLAGEANATLLAMIAGQTVLTGVATMLMRPTENRTAFVGVGIVQVLVTGLVLNEVSVLTFGQRAEVFSTVVGLGLVAAGLVGWRKEADAETGEVDHLTDTNLWVGSLLATVPMTLGLVAVRYAGGSGAWVALHEIGVLAIGLGLVGIGLLCRLRATTLAGGGALVVYLASLLMLLHIPDQLQNVAVYLIVGGATLFGGAVLLSVCRDRLLAIPGRIREGEGVFAVLKWR